ncbi:uncharacterized protein LOC130745638 [Lotus japonicus]|uniref:uncharacterized protein LOC130745638 n=1 Tax=Lotus japonicus TaxID=34305 RepID=UPI0025890636|nr:uncharacterized protein LOC130745638 [Lotus japonicus]
MGSAISKGAHGLGNAIGNAFTTPFKNIFGASCEDVCSGSWDLICFIEHLCVSSLVKLLIILVLCYITLLFFYLFFKLGICQCIGRSLCKMCCAACEACCFAIGDITCYLWHKLINTKRVYRGRRRRQRFRDVELGYSSTDESDPSWNYRHDQVVRETKSLRKRGSDHLHLSRRHHGGVHNRHRHLARMKGSSRRLGSSRRIQVGKTRNRNLQGKAMVFKRRRVG